jgi:hypothetical protein
MSSHIAQTWENLFGGWRYSVWQKIIWVEKDRGLSICCPVRYLPATEGECVVHAFLLYGSPYFIDEILPGSAYVLLKTQVTLPDRKITSQC